MELRKLGPDGQIDQRTFLREVNTALFRGKMTLAQEAGTIRLLDAWDLWGTPLDSQLCYLLATSYLETGHRMQPVLETFASSRAQAAARLERAFAKGQLPWVRTPYWRESNGFHWVGGGDVQLTHEHNYRGAVRDAVLEVFGQDIRLDPDLVLDPQISAFILIEGTMSRATLRGDFTGRALEDYVNETETDYFNARKTVNPGDRPTYGEIERYARAFEKAMVKARLAAGSSFRGAVDSIYSGRYDPQVEEVQRLLKGLGYPEIGTVDGKWGSKTRGGVLAFRADVGLMLEPKIDSALLAALVGGPARAVAEERRDATVEDLREAGSADIARNDSLSRVGKAAAGVGATATVADESGLLDTISESTGQIGMVLTVVDRVKSVVSDNAMLLLVGLGGVVIYMAWRGNQHRVRKHQTGEYLSR